MQPSSREATRTSLLSTQTLPRAGLLKLSQMRETEVGKKCVSVSWGDGLVSRSIWRIGGRYVLHGGPGESLAYAARFEDVLALIRCW